MGLVNLTNGYCLLYLVCLCGGYGGSGGDYFSDSNVSSNGNITTVEIWSGSRIDG